MFFFTYVNIIGNKLGDTHSGAATRSIGFLAVWQTEEDEDETSNEVI